jgi:hypothetical protein
MIHDRALRLLVLGSLVLTTLLVPAPPSAAGLDPAPEPPSPTAPVRAGIAPTSLGTWTARGPDGDLPEVRALAMDGPALAEGTTLVLVSDNGAYRSRDGGASWADWSAGLPSRDLHALVFSAGAFYAAAEGLVYRRGASASAWSAFAEGLPAAPGVINCLAASAGTLVAADCAPTASATARRVFRRGAADEAWLELSAGLPSTRQLLGIALSGPWIYLATRENSVYAGRVDQPSWLDITPSASLLNNDAASLAAGPDSALYLGLRQVPSNSPNKGGVLRYDPLGGWESLNGKSNTATVGGVDVLSLAVAPDGTVVAGGEDGRLYVSSASVDPENIAWSSGALADRLPRTIVLSPLATAPAPDSTLFVGTASGLLRSLTLGRTLSPANSGLALAVNVRQLVAAPDGTLFAASATRVYRAAAGSDGWTTVRELDGATIDALAASSSYDLDRSLFLASQSQGQAALQRSSDGGAAWSTAPLSETLAVLLTSPGFQRDGTLYGLIPGVVGGPQLGGVLLSSDRGASWGYRNSGLEGRTLHALAALPEMAFAPLLVGSDDGVYALDAARAGWSPLLGGTPPGEVRLLAASPAFAADGALFALGPGGLYRFRVQPAGWQRLSANLPLGDVRALAVSPAFAQDQTLIAATGAGVWRSSDAGATWETINEGLPTLDVRALALSPAFATDRSIVAGTAAGLFSYTLPPPAPPWLAMLYLAGDDVLPDESPGALTGLSEPLRLLVERLDAMPYNPALSLVVLFDGDREGDSRLYLREPEGLREVSPLPPWFPADRELDTGSVSTLRSFVGWSRDSFPGARHSFLSIVDHGGGWAADLGNRAQPPGKRRGQAVGRGMSIDETSGTLLSTRDTGTALAGLGPIDVLFFDACLMGMIESAYEVQPHAAFYIAGQNLLWSALPYERYLAADLLGAETSPRELAQGIVARYNQPLPGESIQVEPFAIAALDMARLPDIRLKADALAARLLESLPEGELPPDSPARLAITRAYSEAQKFDYDVSLSIDPTDSFVDLADFARALERPANDISPAVSVAAAELRQAIGGPSTPDSLVVATRAVSGTLPGQREPWSFGGATGLSIYLPLGEQDLRPTGPPSDSLGTPMLERQLFYYTNCDFTGCGQLAFTRDAPAWATLLARLEAGVPARDPARQPLGAPYPLDLQLGRIYLPLLSAANQAAAVLP